jgi:hypothetical protein
MTGIDEQIHVLRVCKKQLDKLAPMAQVSVLKMLLDAVDESAPPPKGQTVIPGALEATRLR